MSISLFAFRAPLISRNRVAKFLITSLVLGLLQSVLSTPNVQAASLTWSDVTGTTFHTKDWAQIRTNNDGSIVGVISQGSPLGYLGDFYLSRDSGSNWNYSNATASLRTLAVSGDGSRAIAAHDSKIYRSVFASGSWSNSTYLWSSGGTGANQRCAGNYGPNFNSLASSTDGTSWIAGARDESCVYTSSDSGGTWYGTSVGATNWGSAISSDGSIKITANSNGNLYRKSGSGSWAAITSSSLPISSGWWAVVCDATCTRITAIQNGGAYLYTSLDSGANWSKGDSAGVSYTDISVSLDGTEIAATDGSDIYISVNSGQNWVKQGQTGKSWQAVTVSGDGKKIYAAASDGTIRKSAFLAAQSALSISTTTGIFGTGLTLATTGGSGTGSVTYSYAAGTTTCSLTGSVLSANGAGTCLITATKSADASYSALSSSQTSITFSKGTQPTILVVSSTTGTFGTPLTFVTTGGNGTGSNSFVVDSGPCTIAGSTLTSTGAGTCMVTATKAADTNYLASNSASTAITIAKQAPTYTWFGVTKSYGDVFQLSAPTPSVVGTFTYSSGNTSVLTLNSETATVVGIGTSIITATFTPTDTTNYLSGGTTMTVTAAKAAITVTPTSGQSKAFGANNSVITYSVTTGSLIGSDALSGALAFTGTNAGSYPITIGTLANSSYTITLALVNFTINQAPQTALSLSSLSTAFNPNNKTVSLTGSGGSGTGTYSYAIDTSNTNAGCTLLGSTLTYTTAGTCIIAVTRSSDSNYLVRTDSVSFSIGLVSQTITFAALLAKSYSSDTFTINATSSASSTVAFTSGAPSICTTSGTNGSIITLLGVGTCVINANQLGDANTSAAAQVTQSFIVNPRTITVTADPQNKVYGTVNDTALTYRITSGSLVLGDLFSGALTRATGTDAGQYAITPGTLTNANNPKYAITYALDYFTITKATPSLVLTYPNSNVVILTPGITVTATVTSSSSNGTLSFASATPNSICSVDTTSGVVSFSSAGSCQVVMTSAATANFLQASDTQTVTSVLQSTSLVGIPTGNLIPMGGTFYASPILTQTITASVGSNGASVLIPANALPSTTAISINLLTDSSSQLALISEASASVLSVVVSWVSPDGSVPQTSAGNPIRVTLTNPSIRSGAKVYSVVGGTSTLVGIATTDGSVTSQITSDPILVVVNPVVVPAPTPVVDNSSAIAAAAAQAAAIKATQDPAAKAFADKQAADAAAKLLAEKQAAQDAIDAAALKAAQEKMAADVKALADAKAAQDLVALQAAQDAADTSAKAVAALQAAKDAALAAAKAAALIKPAVTLYSVSAKLTLSSYDSAYLQNYVRSLKDHASVTCLGYIYKKGTTLAKATALAKSQAAAVCSLMKKSNKTLKTSISLLDSSKAPKAASGAKWVAVSYRIDGFKTP